MDKMGKNLRQQRRGRATPRYRVHVRYAGKADYNELAQGKVTDIIHAPGRNTPLAVVGENNAFMIPVEGMHAGQSVEFSGASSGNVLRLKDVPEGTKICNIELNPGDGGRLCRSAGAAATMVTRDARRCVVMMPSKQKKALSAECKATIGSAASSGRIEKPFMKAGNRYYAMLRRGKIFPRTSGVSMNAVNHPFGGQTRPGRQKNVSHHAPPGRKVGNISPRRTGKKKRK